MNRQSTSISKDEIHAYVDGALDQQRRDEIELLFQSDDELASRASDYISLTTMLHARYDHALQEPIPQRLAALCTPTPKQVGFGRAVSSNWPRFAGLAAALLLGVGIGAGGMLSQTARNMLMPNETGAPFNRVSLSRDESFARQSAIAYVTYAPMVTRPVEVGAEQEHELITWLSNRLGTDVHAPVLTRVGFSLMGGRLLPGDEGPIAQFMYHNAAGERITLNVSRRKQSPDVTAFKLYQEGLVNVFYWVDGSFGYAVSGAISRTQLLAISHDVHEQLASETSQKAEQ